MRGVNGCLAKGARGGEKQILSIFTSTSGHSPDEAASQAVARSRSQDEMTRLLTELHHELLSQIQIDVSEFQQVLEACTNACLSHHLASINNKLAPLLRSFEGAGEPSLEKAWNRAGVGRGYMGVDGAELQRAWVGESEEEYVGVPLVVDGKRVGGEAHLIPCKDVCMRLPEATDFSPDLQIRPKQTCKPDQTRPATPYPTQAHLIPCKDVCMRLPEANRSSPRRNQTKADLGKLTQTRPANPLSHTGPSDPLAKDGLHAKAQRQPTPAQTCNQTKSDL
eukprot:gene11364-17776_t